MDNSQIRTIVVTAAITAAITVTVTLSLTGIAKLLVDLVKNSPTTEKTRQTLKKLFSSKTRSMIWLLMWLSFSVFSLISAIRDPSPLTRIAVFKIAFYVVISELWLLVLIADIAFARATKR